MFTKNPNFEIDGEYIYKTEGGVEVAFGALEYNKKIIDVYTTEAFNDGYKLGGSEACKLYGALGLIGGALLGFTLKTIF